MLRRASALAANSLRPILSDSNRGTQRFIQSSVSGIPVEVGLFNSRHVMSILSVIDLESYTHVFL